MLLLQKQAQKKDEPSSDFPYLCSQESLEPLSVLLLFLMVGCCYNISFHELVVQATWY